MVENNPETFEIDLYTSVKGDGEKNHWTEETKNSCDEKLNGIKWYNKDRNTVGMKLKRNNTEI